MPKYRIENCYIIARNQTDQALFGFGEDGDCNHIELVNYLIIPREDPSAALIMLLMNWRRSFKRALWALRIVRRPY